MFYIVLLILVLVGGLLTVLTVQNISALTPVVLLNWQTPSFPVGLLILLAFLLGALLLYCISALSAWRDQREIGRLKKRVLQLEQQVAEHMEQALPTPSTMPQQPSTSIPPVGSAGSAAPPTLPQS